MKMTARNWETLGSAFAWITVFGFIIGAIYQAPTIFIWCIEFFTADHWQYPLLFFSLGGAVTSLLCAYMAGRTEKENIRRSRECLNSEQDQHEESIKKRKAWIARKNDAFQGHYLRNYQKEMKKDGQ